MMRLQQGSALVFLLAASSLAAEQPAKNVILFLADAGGIPTLHAASVHAYGQPGKLFVQRMPHIALAETSSASDWVTDSAAGMTAIVTGQKTHNGVIAQSDAAVRGNQDGAPLKTMLEYAEERGLSTGVVSNSSIASATPAACYAHVNDRKKVGEIFAQVLTPRFGDGVDLMIGPGRKEIVEGTKSLGLEVETELPKKGYRLVDSIEAIPPGAGRVTALLESDEFDLGAATERAVEILSRNPKGFFLMVESDVHTNRMARGLERMAAFDRIIQRTTERLRGSDTLILFTADHSFDLRLVRSAKKGAPLLSPSAEGSPSVPERGGLTVDGHHSGEEVLVAAQGPGAERVRGFLSNTDLFRIMMAACGWEAGRP
jgi:alkaline phosphatase